MEHEDNCPWNRDQGLVTTPLRRPCEVRKCAVWKDLKTWFGYTGASLSTLAFEEIFRDVAHGGSGLYERMAVEGGNLLRETSRAFAAKKAESNLFVHYVAKLLFNRDRQKKALGLIKQLYIQKEVTIMNDSSLLDYFAKSYLSAAQFLISPRSVSNYVRVLLSFSVNEIAGQDVHKPPQEWLSILLQHIYHSQAFKHLSCDSDNMLLRDMYIFFDYQYDYFLPRIRECFDNLDDTNRCTQISGEELLISFASRYFCELYKAHHGSNCEVLANEFAKSQVREFIQSKCIEVFACVFMRLHLVFIGEEVDFTTNRPLQDCRTIFINLVGACWSISHKETRNIWMANLFQTLRQVQLSIMMHGIHDNTGYINDFLHLPQNAAYEIEAPSTRTVANMVYTPSPELRQYLPSSTEFIDNMFKGTMNFFTQLCTPNKAADVINDNELPIHVEYDNDSKDANIRIPLSRLGNMEPVKYHTVLKSKGERIMELAVSTNNSVPRLDVNI